MISEQHIWWENTQNNFIIMLWSCRAHIAEKTRAKLGMKLRSMFFLWETKARTSVEFALRWRIKDCFSIMCWKFTHSKNESHVNIARKNKKRILLERRSFGLKSMWKTLGSFEGTVRKACVACVLNRLAIEWVAMCKWNGVFDQTNRYS